MASLDERRAGFKRYKEDVERRGKPFFPYAMFHDTVMSLVVVCVIIALAVHLEVHDTCTRALLLHRQGRPGDDELRPAARLVLLLPLLPAADLQVAGDGDPRHDRHPDDLPHAAARAAVRRPARSERRLLAPPRGARRRGPRRPLDGRAHVQGRDGEGGARQRGASARFRRGPRRRASRTTRLPWRARSSSRSPCLTCHTYNGAGSSNYGAPDLTAIGGDAARASSFFEQLRVRPEQVRQHDHAAVRQAAHEGADRTRSPTFLDASKGAQVGAAPCGSFSA